MSNNYTFVPSLLNNTLTFDINNKTLVYADNLVYHGCQCNYNSDEEKHLKINELCEQAVVLLKKIEYYNNYSNDEILDLFTSKYNLKFLHWEKNVAVFETHQFIVDYLIQYLSTNSTIFNQ